jgi:hypothetical protein
LASPDNDKWINFVLDSPESADEKGEPVHENLKKSMIYYNVNRVKHGNKRRTPGENNSF